MIKNSKVLIAVLMLCVIALLSQGGCAAQQKAKVEQSTYQTFLIAKDSYKIVHASVTYTDGLVNSMGTKACKDSRDNSKDEISGRICSASRRYVKFYKDQLQPASVKADEAFNDGLTIFEKYRDGTSDEKTLLEKIKALNEAIAIVQKYLGDSNVIDVIGGTI